MIKIENDTILINVYEVVKSQRLHEILLNRQKGKNVLPYTHINPRIHTRDIVNIKPTR